MKITPYVLAMGLSLALINTAHANEDGDGLVLKRQPHLHYPQNAIFLKQQGTVLIAGEVTPKGQVTAVRIEQSSGHTVLDKTALNHVAQFLFEARPHAPNNVRFEQPIHFKLPE